MSKIIVKNTAIVIEDYDIGSCSKLESFFKIWDINTHRLYYKGLYYDKENRKLYLPRGIDIWYVENLLGEEAIIEKNKYSEYDVYDDILIKSLPRDEVQKETLRFMLAKEEYRHTGTKSQLSVNLNTGKGKTYVSVATFAFLSIKTIIITYANTWLNQWVDRILEYTNLQKYEIYNISGSGSILRLLSKTREEIKRYKIFTVTHATLKSYGDSNGWEKITQLFEHLRIGIKIYDEAHLNFDNMCMVDFYTNVYKTYYLTATKARSNTDENRIYQTCFKNVLSIDLFNQEEDPHTDYIAIRYKSKPTPQEISNCRNQYGLDRNRYTNMLVHKDNFYRLLRIIMDIVNNKLKYGEKCLMYIGTNEGIKIVYEWLMNNYPDLQASDGIGIFTSISEDKEEAKTKRIILTTTKSAGAAVDIKGLKITVVIAEPFKSEVLARQTLGRTRDNNTLYIDTVDEDFRQCSRYYYHKTHVFKKYAKECSEIRLTENELINRSDRLERMMEKLVCPIIRVDKPLFSPIIYL